jgi:hypothetical protein
MKLWFLILCTAVNSQTAPSLNHDQSYQAILLRSFPIDGLNRFLFVSCSLICEKFGLKQAAEQGKDIQMLLTNSPKGFTKYVEQQFDQLAEAADSEKVQALFVLLSVALGALSKSDIKALTGLGAWDLPKLPWQVTRWFSIRSDSYSFAHPLLADQFQEVLGSEETNSATDKLINYCAKWHEHQSPYALRYYADHLQEVKQLELLYELARSEDFTRPVGK